MTVLRATGRFLSRCGELVNSLISSATGGCVLRQVGAVQVAVVVLFLGMPVFSAYAVTLSVPTDDYPTIQTAIDAAAAGDLVEVDIGTYRENIILKDGVDVQGIEAARTFLVAEDEDLPVVDATNIDDVLFAGFTITDSINGLFVAGSSITIASNVFDSLAGSAITINIGVQSDVEIINNVFWDNGVAIRRFIFAVSIINNIFSRNTVTITSDPNEPIDPNLDVSYNCYYENDDLNDAGGDGGLGDNFQIGDPFFVAVSDSDFHLQQDSVCIGAGTGEDVIDATVADMGAYGGDYADAIPYPVAEPTATDSSTTGPDVFNITLDWDANLAYLVTNENLPGSYNVYYQRNEPGPDYNGTDAGNGTQPSPIAVASGTTYTLMDLQPNETAAPGVPVLNSASPQNTSVVLGWAAATGATGYQVHYGEASVAENTLDVGNVTSYTVAGLNNGTEYVFAIGALTQPVYYLAVTALDSTPIPSNESDYSAETSIAIGDPVLGMLSDELSAMPEEVVPYPDLPDKGCFIATAAFGADWVAEVQVLRDFRDRYLLTNAAGRSFVAWYYRNGPVAAEYLEQFAALKPIVRAALWPLVVLAAFMLGASALVKGWVVILVAMLMAVLLGRQLLGSSLARSDRKVL